MQPESFEIPVEPVRKPILHLDIETRSEADLRSEGVYRYAQHPSAKIIIAAWAVDDGPVNYYESHKDQVPDDLICMLRDPGYTKVCHNAQFERTLIQQCWKIPCPPEQYFCTMVQAMSLSLPGALDQLCVVLGLPLEHQKLADGRRLMRLFSIPGRDGWTEPAERREEWRRYVDYCAQDVIAERECYRKMARWPLPAHEHALWCLDQKINERGMPVDLPLVRAALALRELDEVEADQTARELTDLENPNSIQQLQAWVAERGIELEDMRATTVDRALDGDLPDDVRAVLEIRRGRSKSSIKKFNKFESGTCDDGRIRGCFQFDGAGRTGRWAGRLVQPHNFPRGELTSHIKTKGIEGEREKERVIDTARDVVLMQDPEFMRMMYPEPAKVFTGLVRAAIRAPAGKVLVAADYASIESVMLAWASGCGYLLEMFRAGRDPYQDFASHWLNKPYEEVTKAERNIAKPPALGCLALGTKVWTQTGWQRIETITRTQAVWDGVEWVFHEGLLEQGEKALMDLDGLLLTPDHRVLCGVAGRPLPGADDDERSFWRHAGMIGKHTDKVAQTFDLKNAGPRNRFMVGTDKGPIIVHNCGYGLGWRGLMMYATQFKISLTEQQAQSAVETFRTVYAEIPKFWYALEAAVTHVINTRGQARVGRFTIRFSNPFLLIDLPSGRSLAYLRPMIEDKMKPWGEIGPTITYYGRETGGKNFKRLSTFGAKKCENITQAIARDVLAHGLTNADKNGLKLIGHVHDELLAECAEPAGPGDLMRLQMCMRAPDWCKDAPIRSAGWVGEVYRKE